MVEKGPEKFDVGEKLLRLDWDSPSSSVEGEPEKPRLRAVSAMELLTLELPPREYIIEPW